jgi:hypothetical protein
MQNRLDIGGVIGRVWRIYVDEASVLMPAAAVVFVVSGILSSVLAGSGSLFGALLGLVVSLVARTLFAGMVVELVADVQDGRRDSSPGQLLRAASPFIGPLILVGLVAGFAIVIGLFLIVVPGLFLVTIWSVFAPVIVLEQPPGLGALARSRELVRGNGWQVFGVILVLFVGVFLLAGVLELAAAAASGGAGIAVSVIIGVLTAPLTALASAVLYFDLRGLSGEAGGIAGTGLAGLGLD